MNIMKDLFIEEYEKILDEAEENGIAIDDNKACDLAHKRSIDRFADMCDVAKDRMKYGQ